MMGKRCNPSTVSPMFSPPTAEAMTDCTSEMFIPNRAAASRRMFTST